MENAAEALKMAFAVFVFVLSLTIALTMFSQMNETSQAVLRASDITTYYNYKVVGDSQRTRIVGLETIIPTLYKYYKENYTVVFLNKDGNPLPLYNTQTNSDLWGGGKGDNSYNPYSKNIAKYYVSPGASEQAYELKITEPVCAFDVDEETIRHEPWTGTSSDYKKNLDAFLKGGSFEYPSGGTDNEGRTGYHYSESGQRGGFIERYQSKKFQELLGEYYYNAVEGADAEEKEEGSIRDKLTSGLQKNRKKRVIIYKLL